MNELTEDDIREREADPAYGRHSGICRACKEYQFDLSNDDGVCGDCN